MQFNPANGHVVRFDGRAMLFHVPTTALFALDELGAAVIDCAQREGQAGGSALESRFGREAVSACVEQLARLEVLQETNGFRPINPQTLQVEDYPLSTIVLNVNTGCNLGCRYCYKEDLAVPARGERMSFEVAARSVDLLLRQAAARSRVGIVFFGGEPLTNVTLIRQVVDYALARARAEEKTVDSSRPSSSSISMRIASASR